MFYQIIDSDLILYILLQPNAKQSKICGIQKTTTGDKIKLAIQAPAVEGKANYALIVFLAKLLDMPKSKIEILTGDLNRNKKVKIKDISELPEELSDFDYLN